MNNRLLPTLLIGILIWISCNEGPLPEKSSNSPSDLSETQEMVNLLRKAHDAIPAQAVAYHLNSIRAEEVRMKRDQSQSASEQLQFHLEFGYELLMAGKNEDALVELEQLLQQMQQFPGNEEFLFQIDRLRALSYMRMGESQNCIQSNNPESCIFPIKGKGVYTLTEATESAIQIYQSMLERKPNDWESIWMLNIAYMNLGDHPNGVPEPFRIPPSAFSSGSDFDRFPNIANRVGANTLGLSGGTCVDDFNNDGLIDIIASSYGVYDQIHVLFQTEEGQFRDVTESSGLIGITGGLNLQHADVNNDGWLDILVLRGAWFGGAGKVPNSLLLNNGDGTFSDITQSAGLLSYHPTQAAVWRDFNNDGWIDLFIGNESEPGGEVFPQELYINQGLNSETGVVTFKNVINQSGIQDFKAFIKGVTSGDIDNNGHPDLFISVFNGPNKLYYNQGPNAEGTPVFIDVSSQVGVSNPLKSFPCWFWDVNNDGWEDIFALTYLAGDIPAAEITTRHFKENESVARPALYINQGNGKFQESSQQYNLDMPLFAMGSSFGDLDMDGWLDAYIGTGAPSFTAVVPNVTLRNKEGELFEDITIPSGMGHIQKGHGVGFADFDNDGDEDVFCVLGGAFEGDIYNDALFLNPNQDHNWISLKLEGVKSNRAAIGALIQVNLEENGAPRALFRTVSSGGSFGGNSLRQEIGIGTASTIKSVVVYWPLLKSQPEIFENIEPNNHYQLKEASGNAILLDLPKINW